MTMRNINNKDKVEHLLKCNNVRSIQNNSLLTFMSNMIYLNKKKNNINKINHNKCQICKKKFNYM